MLAQKGCDFRHYKKTTILRRVERRMGLHRIQDMGRYYDLLRRDLNELNQLFKDLLINVTSFFRDADAFEELRQKAIEPLVLAKHSDEPLRVWVPACSSGEEAYSIAMLLMEELAGARKNCPLQIFATDIDEDALVFARQAIYPESIAADLGPERLSRFFVTKGEGYRVSEPLRNSVTFAIQNLITDPPFSRMDLISCRNFLIYLDTDTQTKLIPQFNFALNPGGYLFLGKSEGISGQTDLFDVVSNKARLFRRLTPARPVVLETPIQPGRKGMTLPARPEAVRLRGTAFADMIRQAILDHFAASVILIDRKGEILQFHGQTGKYLNMPEVEPRLNLLELAKEGLSIRLRAALHKAAQEGRAVVLDNVPITKVPTTKAEGGPSVRVSIVPVSRHKEAEQMFAVIFEDVSRPPAPPAEQAPCHNCETATKQLEDELRDTQRELQATIEELQASNEELRVANEEVVSSNEELQSTVEELETSKEELQSVNEELATVNSELQDKVEQLDTANKDLNNFLKSSEIATLFLDKELRIRFFTPAATRVLRLRPSDTGRPVTDLSLNFINYDLIGDAREVASGGDVMERQVRHAGGLYYLVRVSPYRAETGQVEGVVVTFNDVTGLKSAEERSRRLATVLIDSNDAVLLFDLDGNILAWNRGAQIMYGWSEAEALRMNVRDITPPGKIAEGAGMVRRLIAGESVSSFETGRFTKDGRVLDIWLTATAVWDEYNKKVEAIATTERDVTGIKRSEKALKDSLAEREILIKELYHRTKNNMNVISNLMSLQANQIKEPVMKQMFKEAQNRIQSMAIVHEMLYKTEDFSNLDLRDYFEQLAKSILASYKKKGIELKYEMDSIPVSLYLALPSGLILNELLSNSIKHAFPENRAGEIAIRLKAKGNEIELSYSDNGVGLPEGFRIEGSKSLGMRILDGLIKKQLSGDWEMISDHGTQVIIRFKVLHDED